MTQSNNVKDVLVFDDQPLSEAEEDALFMRLFKKFNDDRDVFQPMKNSEQPPALLSYLEEWQKRIVSHFGGFGSSPNIELTKRPDIQRLLYGDTPEQTPTTGTTEK